MHVIIEEGLQDLDFINSRTEGYEEDVYKRQTLSG